ncbi:MAG TPA: VWA domain-containing protein [Bacteroidota bacterium]|nr:VWA domain-containing protein [Bacteroidota bacterium]
MKTSFGMVYVLLTLMIPAGGRASDKARFDVQEASVLHGLAKTSGEAPVGWKVGGTIGEVAVLSGGYFTIGTVAGTTSSPLDDHCGVLFGHPYAKTSYPIFQLDGGGWKKPEEIFSPDSSQATPQADNILLVFSGTSSIQASVTYLIINQGQQVEVVTSVKNNDDHSHSVGVGFMIDPALGIHGDGVLAVGGNLLLSESSMDSGSILGKPLVISERRGTHAGLKCSLSFPNGTPSALTAANWQTLLSADGPPMGGLAAPGRIYDLDLDFTWNAVTVPAQGTVTRSFMISLEYPDFGNGTFARWDVPSFLTLDNGVMFPSGFTATVDVFNQHSSSVTSTLKVLPNTLITNTGTDKTLVIGVQGHGYAPIPLEVSEVYEPTVTDLILSTTETLQGSPDSLIIPVFIPPTPVSDTGLTVTIDSLAKRGASGISIFFEAMRNATKEKLVSLKSTNVFLYEDDLRIPSFVLGKDTSGGKNSEDIVFVLDVTGSMSNQIDGVKNNITEFADSLTSRGVDYRLALVTFLDAVENVYAFTSSVATFKDEVSLQYAHGGGDLPENSLDALYTASQLPYRSDAGRVIVWITDDRYHEKDDVTTRDRQSVVNALLANDIVVNSIGTAMYQTDWYRPITDPTGGQCYDISGNFRDILLDIGRLQSISRYMLTYTSPSTSGGSRTAKIEVHYGGVGGSASVNYTPPGGGGVAGKIVCFPNPFNPQTTFRLSIPAKGYARISVYSLLGQRVRTLDVRAGGDVIDVVWDATDDAGRRVASGIYIVRSTVYSPGGEVVALGTLKALFLK